ncbi:MAG: hypothetical protein ACP5O0_02110 [Acidimicrobiales bacterium]
MAVWCDDTSEPLAAVLRPGNAGSNNAEHHCQLLTRTLNGLPSVYQLGHHVGDRPQEAVHPILVRADSAGAKHLFVQGIRDVNCSFFIGHPITQGVRAVLQGIEEEAWVPLVEKDGTSRDGAHVFEITDLLDQS